MDGRLGQSGRPLPEVPNTTLNLYFGLKSAFYVIVRLDRELRSQTPFSKSALLSSGALFSCQNQVGLAGPQGCSLFQERHGCSAILYEAEQFHNVSGRLDSLSEQHPLVSEALLSISGSVRNTATLLEVLVAMKMAQLSGLDPASA